MTTKRTYKTYPRGFKEEAMALVYEQGYSVQKAADAVGIRSNMLYRWKDQLGAEKAGKVLSEDERIEIKGCAKQSKHCAWKRRY